MDWLLLGREAADPVERAALEAGDLTGDVGRVDEVDLVKVRKLVALGVGAPVGGVLGEHGAVLSRDGFEDERASADGFFGRVLDGLAEHQRAVVGKRRGELRVDLAEGEDDGGRVGGRDLLDVGVDVGHRRAQLLAAQPVHRVDDVGRGEGLAVAELDSALEGERPHLAVRGVPLGGQRRLDGEVLPQRHELLVDLLLQQDVGHGAREQGRVEVDVTRLHADLEDAALLDRAAGARAGAAAGARRAAAGDGGHEHDGERENERGGQQTDAPGYGPCGPSVKSTDSYASAPPSLCIP